MARGWAVSSHRRRRQQAPDHDRRVLPAVLKKMSYAARSMLYPLVLHVGEFHRLHHRHPRTGVRSRWHARSSSHARHNRTRRCACAEADEASLGLLLRIFRETVRGPSRGGAHAQGARGLTDCAARRTAVKRTGGGNGSSLPHVCRRAPKGKFKKIASARQRTAAFLYYDQLMHRRCDAGDCAVRGSGPGQRSLRASSY